MSRSDTQARQFRIRERVFLQRLPISFSNLELWLPLVPDTPYQRCLEVDIVCPHATQWMHEPEYGNPMVYTRFGASAGEPLIEITTRVERWACRSKLSPERVTPMKSLHYYQKFLKNDNLTPVSSRTADLARQITSTSASLLENARSLFHYAMETQIPTRRWDDGSVEEPLFLTLGAREDTVGFLISLLRAAGIASRAVQGFLLDRPGEDETPEAGAGHVWAEFFAPGEGWIPADLLCAQAHKKPEFFGSLESTHVALSHGRQVPLVPSPKGQRPAIFASPHCEVDGQLHRHVSRNVLYRELSAAPQYSGF